ncbi:MAG: 16S rRNA (cytosine(1402)-N(4))-methyltransferase RsmH [Candidatus Promineifilaceae bacterium]
MHKPVLYQEVIDYLQPGGRSRYIDATVGAGGHALGLLKASAPDGIVVALDRDPMAIEFARQRLAEFKDRVTLVNASYEQMAIVASQIGMSGVDGVLMDLGLSSMQLADSERGFSFQEDGPLDMRFDTSRGSTAADLINAMPEEGIADILWRYGDVRESKRFARAIVRERPIDSTLQLADLILKESRTRGKIHPATRIFQALRIAVNDELETLKKGLAAAIDVLKIGGRLAVISFHSLEDRIVKHFIREQSRDCVCPPEYPVCICDARPVVRAVHRKVIRPAEAEVQSNPRSRSARMRVAEKVAEVIA